MKPERRSWQFWVWGFIFLFLAHAVAVLQFGERQLPASLQENPRPFIYLSLDEASERRIVESTLGRDPTLFALPSPHGFSGAAWLKFRPEATRLSNWSAAPEWLKISVEQLGFSLNEFVATNRPSEDQLLASLRATRQVDVSLPDEPVIKRTLVTVDGPIAGRKLVHAPPLPSAGHNDILKRTIVNVAINGDGVVESASLSRESGSRTADTSAVELARAFQFEPVRVSTAAERTFAAPMIGRLIFNWHVTNAPAGAPR